MFLFLRCQHRGFASCKKTAIDQSDQGMERGGERASGVEEKQPIGGDTCCSLSSCFNKSSNGYAIDIESIGIHISCVEQSKLFGDTFRF